MAALILDEPTAGVDIEIRPSPPGTSAIREGLPPLFGCTA